jgi:hypothetical protein
MTPEDLKFLQDNAPHATEEQIREAFYKHTGNLLETLTTLLEIPMPVPKEKTEWEKRRDIYDELDRQMQLKIQRSRQPIN